MADVGYTLSRFNDIACNGIDYKLTPEVIAIIKTLNGLLQDQTSVAKRNNEDFQFKNGGGGGNKTYSSRVGIHDDGTRSKPSNNRTNTNTNTNASTDWAVLRSYKTTQIDEKQGIEKTLSLVRMTLNKLSNKNYEQPRDAILLLITEIIDAESSDDDSSDNEKPKNYNLRYITQSIFDIASANKFYSEIYATLYKELVDKHGIFRELLSGFIQKYMDTFRRIQYIDADDNYDQFCEYTKVCDQQKATSAFIVHLLKMGVLTAPEIFKLIHEFYLLVLDSMRAANRENETEEIAECMSILIIQSKAVLIGHGEWTDTVVPMYTALASMKVGDYKSLTSRAIFKFRDINLGI